MINNSQDSKRLYVMVQQKNGRLKMFLMMQLVAVFCCVISSQVQAAEKNIIVLLGSSSAGKSSLARCLQAKLGEGFAVGEGCSVEHYGTFRRLHFIAEAKRVKLLDEAYSEVNGLVVLGDIKTAIRAHRDETGEDLAPWFKACWDHMEERFYEHIAALAITKGVILDSFVMREEQFMRMTRILGDRCFLVFVHVPLENIVDRVRSRNASGDASARRGIDRVLNFYPHHYAPALEIVSLAGAVTHDAIEAAVAYGSDLFHEEGGLPKWDTLVESMAKTFGLREGCALVFPQPKWPCDLLVNTGELLPEEAAGQVLVAMATLKAK